MIDDDGFLLLGKNTVQLKPYIPRAFKQYEELTDTDLMLGVGGTLIFDSECHPNYFLVAFKCIRTGKVLKMEAPFNERKLSWILHNYTVVGFNSFKYDIPLLWFAYKNQNTYAIKEVSNKLVFQNIWPSELQKEYGFEIFKTPHIDLIEVCPLRGSLKLYMARLHAKRIQELPFDHMKELTNEEKTIVADYCVNDLDGTHLLFNNLTEQLKLRADLSREYNQDLMSKSDAQIAEAVIGSELKKITGRWPGKPKLDGEWSHKFVVPSNMFFQTEQLQKVLELVANAKFSIDENGRLERGNDIANLKIKVGDGIYRMGIGGLHSSEENISIKSNDEYQIYDRDVASFYPRIVLNLKLFPTHIGDNFSQVYNSIVERRLAAKAAKRIAESENLKVTINGTFGKTGSPYSILYAPEMTIQITVGGQLYLLMLIEALEINGIPVYSANTDGIVIKCPHSKRQHMLDIIKWWENTTGFETEETEYAAVYSRDVNAYIAVKKPDKEGKIKVKGKNVYYDPWRPDSAKDAYWRFQKNPNAQISVEAIEKLLTNGVPIEQTITDCKDITKFVSVKNVKGGAHKDGHYLGRVVRWYIAKGVMGTINYVLSGNKVPDTDGAKPCMDLPDAFPDDVNYQWYIDRANDMLVDMDHTQKGKQLVFF